MESLDPRVMEMFRIYCETKGITGLEMNDYFQRLIWDAVQMGMTPEDLKSVIVDRQKGVRNGIRRPQSLLMRNLFGTEGGAEVMDEAAAIRSRGRIKVLDPARSSLLKQTGRPETTGTDKPAQTSAEVTEKLLKQFRESAG